MKLLASLSVATGVLIAANVAQAQTFAIEFDWGNIPLCNTGAPNTVSNPTFRLSNVPKGTKFIKFGLTDLDVPSYNHGGGTVAYSGQVEIKPGAFKYESPCPPGGSHTYEWEATAKNGDGFFADSLGSAKASTKYP
jgi:phosphatidylethanolamine-binding protein (PEBP) family uncharacterized protein